MTDKAGYPQAAFGGDTIHTVTLNPQEQATYASGWNRAIEAAAKVCGEPGVGWLKAEAIRALPMPAPALAQAWRVKPMEWEAAQDKTDGRYHYGSGVFGHWYSVKRHKAGAWECSHYVKSKPVTVMADGSVCHPTLEAAKAAAQADYAARILAALIPDTEGGA